MDVNSLAHTKWNCKYHVVFAPKFRRKIIYHQLREDIGKIIRMLCDRKDITIIEAELCPDHIHMLISIPPKTRLYPNRDRKLLFNEALNHTLTRTIMTSSTTVLVLIVILVLGGDSIRAFSFAMILGVIFGTLSSIFLAAPIAYLTLSKRDRKESTSKAVAQA